MNRYNNLLPQENWVSSYIPLPLSEIANAGARKQEQYDTNKDVLNKSVLDNNIKSIEEHDPYRQMYIKQFNDQAQALVDSNIDFGSHQGRSAIQNLIKQTANNPNLQILNRSIDNKKQTLEDLEAIKKEKGAYGYWNDPLLKEEKLKSLGVNSYMDNNGNPIEYQRQTINRREDHVKPVTDLFDKVKEDTDLNAWAQFSGDQTTISTGKKGWKGITPEKIQAIADRNVGTFKNTEGGQDFLRKFQFDYANELAQMSPEQRQKTEDSFVKQHLYNIGSAYVNSNAIEDRGLSTTRLFDNNADKTGKTQMIFDEKTPIVDLAKNAFDTDKLEKKDRNKAFPGVFTGSMGSYISGASGEQIKDANKKNISYGTLTPDEQKIYDGVAKNIFPGITNKDELNTKVKTYLDNINGQQVSTYAESIPDDITYPYSGDKKGAEGLTHSVFGGDKLSDVGSTGHYLNRNFYDPESGKTLSGTQFYENILKDQSKNTPIQVTNQFSNKNPFTVLTGDDKFSRSYQIIVGNKQYIMSGADKEIIKTKNGEVDQSANDRFINKISRIQYSPDKQGEIQVPVIDNGKYFNSKADVRINPEGLWEMSIPEIGATFKGASEEELRDAYSEYFKQQRK